mmetsp:Transcript_703/g.1818  ORF Transcript_703/g.1818 Transcript_703/m.1818 type:complete len:389 (+) Transcript_703:175-1341(+)|eukprot:CAMPEP_0185841062 /NCGR_PEP_ID=MMETSP1353-20130828/17281_2 /TAXON_ID=1077150 /ORGANISM="Erythrolobus australicus, Strain CCMP3124" /LENGTH=388 /DNA_ID=CAMNT_0028540465 /DNA_START=54 /DNA_END=1220 /DNA_ORIENTATION=-
MASLALQPHSFVHGNAVEDEDQGSVSDNNSRSAVLSICSAPENVTRLPDDIISCFIRSLSAKDLVSLELVNHRMLHVVKNDAQRWKSMVLSHWTAQPSELMSLASTLAGGWRRLFIEKMVTDKTTHPWMAPSVSELDAMIQVIVDRAPALAQSNPESALPSASFSPSVTNFSPSSVPVFGYRRRSASSSCEELSAMRSSDVLALDVAISVVIDGSSSVTDTNFSAMLNFARSVTSALQRKSCDAAVGVIQFNQQPRVELPLTSVHSGLLQQQLCSLQQLMGSTNVASAMKRGLDMLSGVSARSRVLLLLTDGHMRDEERRLAETYGSVSALQIGVRTFTIGVGRDVDVHSLVRIVTAARSGHASSPRIQPHNLPLYYGAHLALRMSSG